MVDKVNEDEATASLSAGLALLVEESLFCTGCGLSSLSPAAECTEAGDMVGKEAEDVSRASLSVGPILAAEEVPSLLVVFPLLPTAPATAGDGDPVSPLVPATEHGDCLPSTLPALS